VPLSLNAVLTRNWNKAKKVFALSTYFKENVLSTARAQKKPLKILQDMHRWNALLSLDSVRTSLQEEKKQIFKIVVGHFDRIKL